jgi:hypothetical protein
MILDDYRDVLRQKDSMATDLSRLAQELEDKAQRLRSLDNDFTTDLLSEPTKTPTPKEQPAQIIQEEKAQTVKPGQSSSFFDMIK